MSPRPGAAGGYGLRVLSCRVPPQMIGGFGVHFLDAERLMVGVATIDPSAPAPNSTTPGPNPHHATGHCP